jgi:hypothetical protein
MTEQERSSRTSHQVNEVRVHSDPKFAKIRDLLWFHQSSQLHNVDPSPQTDYSPQTQLALFERKTFSGVFNGGAANSCSFLLLRLLLVVSAFVNESHDPCVALHLSSLQSAFCLHILLATIPEPTLFWLCLAEVRIQGSNQYEFLRFSEL